MSITLENTLPPYPHFQEGILRAPDRGYNALRYIPPEQHSLLAPEFLEELKARGRV